MHFIGGCSAEAPVIGLLVSYVCMLVHIVGSNADMSSLKCFGLCSRDGWNGVADGFSGVLLRCVSGLEKICETVWTGREMNKMALQKHVVFAGVKCVAVGGVGGGGVRRRAGPGRGGY